MRRSILATLIVLVALTLGTARFGAAQPTVAPGYKIELVANGAQAADGIAIFGGYVYVADSIGTLLRVPTTTTNGTFEVVASGFPHPTDVAVTEGGRIFLTDSTAGQIIEVGAGKAYGDFSTATSINVVDGDLFVTNSDPGTITRTTFDGNTTTVLAGRQYPYGLSADGTGRIFFLEHGNGNMYRSTVTGATPELIAVGTAWGVVFTAVQPPKNPKSSRRGEPVLFISDCLANVIWKLEGGAMSVFASGFAGKSNPPNIGPMGLEFDSSGALYVADAWNLWRISPTPKHPRK